MFTGMGGDDMKRLSVFLVLAVALAVVVLAGPGERFVKFDTIKVSGGGASGHEYFIPTFLGAAFRPDKISLNMGATADGHPCTLVVYIPLDKGPVMATDSLLIILATGQSLTTPSMFHYYGPVSDTMRVGSDADSFIRAYAYGR